MGESNRKTINLDEILLYFNRSHLHDVGRDRFLRTPDEIETKNEERPNVERLRNHQLIEREKE